jgi:rare lipoprotein A
MAARAWKQDSKRRVRGRSKPGPRAATCRVLLLCSLLTLTGCGTFSGRSGTGDPQVSSRSPVDATRKRGGYYLDDGPGDKTPADLDAVPDAVPRWEPLSRGAARPYTVMGRSYTPMTELAPYRERGVATWYGRRYHGQRTSSGEVYDMYAMTGAHTTLPIPSYARITNVNNGRSVIVRINDRGPFLDGRLVDLSYVAAHKLDIVRNGSAVVEVESVLPGRSQSAAAPAPPRAPAIEQRETASAAVTESTPVQAPGGPGHYLQLGAFSVQDNAQRFMERLQVDLGDTSVRLSIASANSVFRVHAGPYASRAEALDAAQRIGQVLGTTPILAAPR